MPHTIRADINLALKVPKKVSKYPFAKMKVGDSFAVDPEDLGKVRVNACLYGKRSAKIKKNRKKFAVRRVDPLHDKNYRCWRVK